MDAIAALCRVYMAIPLLLLGRVRALVFAAIGLAVTAPFLGWDRFIRDFPLISATLARQAEGGLSALAVPVLIPFAVLGLLLVGRRKAAWLIVPALWPNSQLYYGVIALPIVAEVPLATIALATPFTPGIVAIGVFAQGVWNRLRERRATPVRRLELT